MDDDTKELFGFLGASALLGFAGGAIAAPVSALGFVAAPLIGVVASVATLGVCVLIHSKLEKTRLGFSKTFDRAALVLSSALSLCAALAAGYGITNVGNASDRKNAVKKAAEQKLESMGFKVHEGATLKTLPSGNVSVTFTGAAKERTQVTIECRPTSATTFKCGK